jgi:hypothetical protein
MPDITITGSNEQSPSPGQEAESISTTEQPAFHYAERQIAGLTQTVSMAPVDAVAGTITNNFANATDLTSRYLDANIEVDQEPSAVLTLSDANSPYPQQGNVDNADPKLTELAESLRKAWEKCASVMCSREAKEGLSKTGEKLRSAAVVCIHSCCLSNLDLY